MSKADDIVKNALAKGAAAEAAYKPTKPLDPKKKQTLENLHAGYPLKTPNVGGGVSIRKASFKDENAYRKNTYRDPIKSPKVL